MADVLIRQEITPRKHMHGVSDASIRPLSRTDGIPLCHPRFLRLKPFAFNRATLRCEMNDWNPVQCWRGRCSCFVSRLLIPVLRLARTVNSWTQQIHQRGPPSHWRPCWWQFCWVMPCAASCSSAARSLQILPPRSRSAIPTPTRSWVVCSEFWMYPYINSCC